MTSAQEAAGLQYTSLEEIGQINEGLRKTFLTGKTRDLEYRKNQVKQLCFLLKDNQEALVEAIQKDLGRPKMETMFAEVQVMINDCVETVAHLDKWAKDESKWAGITWATHKAVVRKEPKGSVLVLGAWNYPLSVQIGPIIPAIAAGNTVAFKPSEVAAHSAKLLSELWVKYLDQDSYRIINGGIPQSTALLDLRWEHIFYTGNGTVGRIVAEKAAKWLCPTTLELGGKSPTYIDETCDLKIATRRILWGKTFNNGQTCIAPDYIICPRSFQDKLIAEFKNALNEFYPNGAVKSDSYSRIINEGHWKRINGMVGSTKGNIAAGGDGEQGDKLLTPTIVGDCKAEDSLMAGEIFGPILPILPVKDVDEAISFINSRDQPLALYIFADQKVANKIADNTRSGGLVVGDTLLHFAISALPFGGTGPSGYGNYHGEHGFKTFSHERAMLIAPHKGFFGGIVERAMKPRYPPYSDGAIKYFAHLNGKAVNFSRPSNPHTSKSKVSTST